MMETYNQEFANDQDCIAWILCQIIDDDAPLRWKRYRFAADCIATNKGLMGLLRARGEFLDA
jgi:hypothetical protein